MRVLERRLEQVDAKVERIIAFSIEARFEELYRRLGGIEQLMREGQNQRSLAAWQILILVLGLAGTGLLGFLMASASGG